MENCKKYKLIDLFCGAGGLSLGFSDMFGHHFEPVWANDFNQYAADTYNENYGKHCVVGDIIDILKNPLIQSRLLPRVRPEVDPESDVQKG